LRLESSIDRACHLSEVATAALAEAAAGCGKGDAAETYYLQISVTIDK
jgi:hypothetical protein